MKLPERNSIILTISSKVQKKSLKSSRHFEFLKGFHRNMRKMWKVKLSEWGKNVGIQRNLILKIKERVNFCCSISFIAKRKTIPVFSEQTLRFKDVLLTS